MQLIDLKGRLEPEQEELTGEPAWLFNGELKGGK